MQKIKNYLFKITLKLVLSLVIGLGLFSVISFLIQSITWRYFEKGVHAFNFLGIKFYEFKFSKNLVINTEKVNILLPVLMCSLLYLCLLQFIEYIIRRKNEKGK